MAHSARDWRDLAACKSVSQEMVPDFGDTAALQLGKKVCAGCPVQVSCLLDAEELRAELGAGGWPQSPRGLWGGLTERERDTMVGLGRWPAPCTRCEVDCVPAALIYTECYVCKPNQQIRYDDYRAMIEDLIGSNWSYEQVARQLRLTVSGLATACARWGVKPKVRSRSGYRGGKPCGTLAAKVRHHRMQKKTGDPADGFLACPACRHVKWGKGKAASKE